MGHVIKNGVVMPASRKTDGLDVLKFPESQNVQQLHSFLGLRSYFRKYIQNYAVIAQHLTSLLKKEL